MLHFCMVLHPLHPAHVLQLMHPESESLWACRSSSDKPRRERIAQMPYTSGTRDWSNFLGGAALFSQACSAVASEPPYACPDDAS